MTLAPNPHGLIELPLQVLGVLSLSPQAASHVSSTLRRRGLRCDHREAVAALQALARLGYAAETPQAGGSHKVRTYTLSPRGEAALDALYQSGWRIVRAPTGAAKGQVTAL